jgi:hypothetical protein
MDILRLLEYLGRPWLSRAARCEVRAAAQQAESLRTTDEMTLHHRAEKGESISLGVFASGKPVRLSLADVQASAIICGATGSGKTKAAEVLLRELLPLAGAGLCGIGVIDCKGDLVDAAISTTAELDSNQAIQVLNLSDRESVIPYDILIPRQGESSAELVARRMETFGDILGREGQLSLRMLRMLRYFLGLLVEFSLSFASLEHLLEAPQLALALARESEGERLRHYFAEDFEKEKSSTLPALRYRLDHLLALTAVRFSFSAGERFDFQEKMDQGGVILINLAGAGPASPVFQSLMLSDLRQATFARQRISLPFLWLVDEAQVLFDRASDKDNLATILCMSRSFGVHLVLITQSLGSTFGDSGFYQNLETNFRWLLLLRSGPKDAAIIRSGLRVTGMIQSGSVRNGRPLYLTPEQEVRCLLQEIPNLPAQEAYFWLRGSGAKAMRMKTHTIKSTMNSAEQAQLTLDRSFVAKVQTRLKSEEERLRTLRRTPATSNRLGLDQLLAEVERDYQEPT